MADNGSEFALQPVKTMAEHRNKAAGNVLAAVNADFFEWTGVPWGPVFIDGSVIRDVSKESYLSYFAVKKDGTVQTGVFSELPVAEHANFREFGGGGATLFPLNGSPHEPQRE